MRSFYEFFAGGGMVRAGLGPGWRCLFANDFDHKKGQNYCKNWGDAELKTADVGSLTTKNLPGIADMVWASFPCQDLSVAGGGAGLKGARSGTLWRFWALMEGMMKEGRAPRLIVLENVCGTLTSHDGKDFATICRVFQQAGYGVGAAVVNAALFVPQSRPRLFVIAVHKSTDLPGYLTAAGPMPPWHTLSVRTAYEKLPRKTKRAWLWWKVPVPPPRKVNFIDVIEDNPKSPAWFTAEETRHLISMMSPINRAKVEEAKRQGRKMVGGVYKRTRPNKKNRTVQRARSPLRRYIRVFTNARRRVEPPGCDDRGGPVRESAADLQQRDGAPHGFTRRLQAPEKLQPGVSPDRRRSGCASRAASCETHL